MKKTILKIMVLATGFTTMMAQSTPSYIPSNGLVGWWPFNGDAKDESGKNNHGTVTGATLAADRFGNPNKAYSFDGVNNHRIVVPNSTSLNITGAELSIAYWVYSDNSSNDALFKGVSKGGWTTGTGYELIFRNSYSGDNGAYQFSTPGNPNPNLVIASNVNGNTGKWVHLVGTLKNGSAKIYINGVLVTTTTLANFTNLRSSLDDLHFGPRHSSNEGAGQLKGKLDDIAIWSRELSAQEITNISKACQSEPVISVSGDALKKGATINLQTEKGSANETYLWQSDFGLGFQNLKDTNQYSGTQTNVLKVSGLQPRNHQQAFRVIAKSSSCASTSKPFLLSLDNPCVISVADTLIIDVVLSDSHHPDLANTIKVFPNPTKDFLMIHYGDFTSMQGYSVNITNATGSVVYQSAINEAGASINLSSLGAKGLYLIHIINPQNQIKESRKIVLQ